MTDTPAPPPVLPKTLQRPSLLRRVLNSTLLPIALAVVAIVMATNVQIDNARNTEDIARTSQQVSAEAVARSQLTAEINSRLQAAFCDLVTSISNPSIVPATPVGKENTLKYRNTVNILACPHPPYTITDDQLVTK